jgi:hypothetical protein
MEPLDTTRQAGARPRAGGWIHRLRRLATPDHLAIGGLFALIFGFGAWMRLDQIGAQIIADDEWHAIHFLIENGYAGIFWHFGIADHCIPMTLFDKLVADKIGLSELWMRAPPLVCGMAALAILPAMLWSRVGPKMSLLFAALLAMSPLHVYFSRYARPYAVIFFLALVGVLAFERFQSAGSRRWAWTYVVCAILVPWFHLMMLPLMLAPLAFALLGEIRDRKRLFARIRELLPFAAVIAVGLTLLLLPPILADFATIRERAGRDTIQSYTTDIGYELVSGTGRRSTALLFGAAFMIGLFSCWSRRRRLFLYFAFLVACQTGAVLYSRPAHVDVPIAAVRYVFPLVGLALLVVAEGLVSMDEWLERETRFRPVRHAPSVLACIAFVLWSPVISPLEPQHAVYYRPSAWTNHAFYQYQYTPVDRLAWLNATTRPKRISEFYGQLAKLPHGGEKTGRCIVEAPWCSEWSGIPFNVYQRLHRWPMAIGFVHEPGAPRAYDELPWPDKRFRFRNFVDLADYEGLRARGVAFVVLHKNLRAEMPFENNIETLPLDTMLKRYRRRLGPPFFEDADVIAFDLRPLL